MKLVVFGANGSTGRLLTKQALAEGHAVTAVTRHLEAVPLRDARLRVLGGDVFDLSSVGVRRLVCVSSSGVDPHPGLGGFFFRKVLQPFFIGVVGRTLYADLKRMETLVGNSNLTGQTWRTSCSSNSPMTSTCTRLWRWRHARERPTSICSLERGDQQEAQPPKGRPAAGPPQMQRAGSSHRSVIAYGP